MRVTVDVKGEGIEEVTLEPGATYGTLIDAVSLSPHEATAIVDGQPVPDDRPVDAEAVTVLRLVKGG